jgi:hypothetical protein
VSPHRSVRVAAVLLSAVLVAGCTSPEARRTRGDGPGADVGNHGRVVVFHEGARMYYKTPCATVRLECKGPPPVFGVSTTHE